MYDGRRLYHQVLKMVKETVSSFGKTGTLELLSSVVALCLHEVANAQNSFAAPNNHFL
jgi:hypothetical protein